MTDNNDCKTLVEQDSVSALVEQHSTSRNGEHDFPSNLVEQHSPSALTEQDSPSGLVEQDSTSKNGEQDAVSGLVEQDAVSGLFEQDLTSGLVEQDSTRNLDRVASYLDALSFNDLIEVQRMLDALMDAKLGKHKGRGHIERRMVFDKKSGKEYGPYRYLRYWKDGKLLCRYLGKENKRE